ncbi:MAG: hypothetical protein II932_02235, partial [Treponema sp.]|nr:hypothetical protein [Treponema sp.]
FQLLPAVAQFDIISRFARRYFGISPFIPRIRRVKFSSPVYPGSRVRLTMRLDREKSSLSFELADAGPGAADCGGTDGEHGDGGGAVSREADSGGADSGPGTRLLSSGTFSVVLQDAGGQNDADGPGNGGQQDARTQADAGTQAVSTYGGVAQSGGPGDVP